MIPREHMLWSFGFCIIIGMLFPSIGIAGIFIIFSASILIDVDHYFASVLAGNGWSLDKAMKWYETKGKTKEEFVAKTFMPLHSIEFLLILSCFLLFTDGLMFNIIIYLLAGFIFHIILDLSIMIYKKEEYYYKVSLIYTYFKNRKLLLYS
jgi:hypothetical protein